MIRDFEKLMDMFPNTQLIYSDLLARRNWRGLNVEDGERRKERVNTLVGHYVRAKGGVVMHHDDIVRQNIHLFRDDGVHLTDIGNDIFIQDLRETIQMCLYTVNNNK